MNIRERFEQFDDEFNKFENIDSKYTNSPHIHAFVLIGALFGQFNFFWEFEKNMLNKMKLGFIGKYVDSKLKKEQ